MYLFPSPPGGIYLAQKKEKDVCVLEEEEKGVAIQYSKRQNEFIQN